MTVTFRRDRDLDFHQKLDGGGVLIAVLKNRFNNIQRLPNLETSVEDIFLKCTIDNSIFCISCAYVKPQTKIENLDCLENCENNLTIVGDYNAPHLDDISKFATNAVYSSLRNSFNTCNLSQFNNVRNENNVILDLILSKMMCKFSGPRIL
jgi:hypothetical protein